jgi:superfamily I DNA/RNA helicase
VLFRTNQQCRPLEMALRSRGIRYRVVGTFSFFDRREVRDLLAFARVAVNPADDSAFLRIFNLPPRGLGSAALDLVRRRAAEGRQNLRPAAEQLLADPGAALPPRAREGLRDLIDVVTSLGAEAGRSGTSAAFQSLVARIRYSDHLGKDTPEPLDLATRLATVEDLVGMARDFDARGAEKSLSGFLRGLALKEDDRDEDERPAVPLLTIHAAKGLEFEHVFVAGVEEGVIPHKKTLPPGAGEAEDPETPALGIEEERRLFYVALTRAKRGLSLSHAKSRVRWGKEVPSKPSRFLTEMGMEGVVVQDGTSREPASPEFRRRAMQELAARFPKREAAT